MKPLSRWILLAGDLLALSLFVVVGQADHQTLDLGDQLGRTLLQIGAFTVPWVVAGLLLGAFPRHGEDPGLRTLLARSLNAWLVAAPLGMVLRALALGRAAIPVPFFLVTVAVGGAFLLGWRLIFWSLFLRRRAADRS